MRPVPLPANQFPHFYRGGGQIARFRGDPPGATDGPEDWVGSTTARSGSPTGQGLSRLPDGRLLRDAVAADPSAWLGPAHREAFGEQTGLLVKLLDCGQRLLVHVHPDRDFAGHHLGSVHGKTEAWIVLQTTAARPQAHLGFRRDMDPGVLADWVRDQRTEELLAALNPVPVAAGDAILVPAGLPHALGAGIFIVELQEPTDFSLLLEWKGFAIAGEKDGHLGLGFDLALQAVDRQGWDGERLARLRGPVAGSGPREPLLPPAASPFFRAELVRAGARCESSFAVLVVTAGAGELVPSDGAGLPVQRGDTVLVPYAAGDIELTGDAVAVRCLPPDPAGDSAPARPLL